MFLTLRRFRQDVAMWMARRGSGRVGSLGEGDPEASKVRPVMQVVISLIVLGVGLFVIIKGGSEGAIKWAHSAIGAVLGYWLR